MLIFLKEMMRRQSVHILSLSIVFAFAITIIGCHKPITDPVDAPKAALKAALDALNMNDIDTYMASIDLGTDLDSIQEESLRSVLRQHVEWENSNHPSVASVDIVDVDMQSDTMCTVYFQYTYADSLQEIASQKMVRTGGVWKLRLRN